MNTLEFKNIRHISLEQWIEQELKNNPQSLLDENFKSELQSAYHHETDYVQYRLAREKFLASTIKS